MRSHLIGQGPDGGVDSRCPLARSIVQYAWAQRECRSEQRANSWNVCRRNLGQARRIRTTCDLPLLHGDRRDAAELLQFLGRRISRCGRCRRRPPAAAQRFAGAGQAANNSASGCWARSVAISRSYSAIVSLSCCNMRHQVFAPPSCRPAARRHRSPAAGAARIAAMRGSVGWPRIIDDAPPLGQLAGKLLGRRPLQLALRGEADEQGQKTLGINVLADVTPAPADSPLSSAATADFPAAVRCSTHLRRSSVKQPQTAGQSRRPAARPAAARDARERIRRAIRRPADRPWRRWE